VDAALKDLADPAWRAWLHAREQLVASGLPAMPRLLAAMSEADGELRDRIEGCISRNARDARNGRRRGKLDASKVLPYLDDGHAGVRDIAAELIVSADDKGTATVRASLKKPAAAASVIRALGLKRDASCSADLIAVLGAEGMPVRARAEAARVLGLLRVTDAADALRKALTGSSEITIRKAALWSLAQLGCTAADKEIAALLESEDTDARYRAAMALAILKSPETKRVIPWLSGQDRYSLELAGWVIWRTMTGEEAKATIQEAIPLQKDQRSRERLEQLVAVHAGTSDKRARYR
jgi:HEAT repeat protein